MPEVNVPLVNRRVASGWAILTAVCVLAGLILLVGYGDDYKSCERQAAVRDTLQVRGDATVRFWRTAAATRERSAIRGEQLAAALAPVLTRTGDPAALAQVRGYLLGMAREDRSAAAKYRRYADDVARHTPPSLNCRELPPPT